MIVERTQISGSGKGASGWFRLTSAAISYDHPTHALYEYALNVDLLDQAAGSAARVAAELSPESARRLAEAILAALDRGEAYEAGRRE